MLKFKTGFKRHCYKNEKDEPDWEKIVTKPQLTKKLYLEHIKNPYNSRVKTDHTKCWSGYIATIIFIDC